MGAFIGTQHRVDSMHVRLGVLAFRLLLELYYLGRDEVMELFQSPLMLGSLPPFCQSPKSRLKGASVLLQKLSWGACRSLRTWNNILYEVSMKKLLPTLALEVRLLNEAEVRRMRQRLEEERLRWQHYLATQQGVTAMEDAGRGRVEEEGERRGQVQAEGGEEGVFFISRDCGRGCDSPPPPAPALFVALQDSSEEGEEWDGDSAGSSRDVAEGEMIRLVFLKRCKRQRGGTRLLQQHAMRPVVVAEHLSPCARRLGSRREELMAEWQWGGGDEGDDEAEEDAFGSCVEISSQEHPL